MIRITVPDLPARRMQGTSKTTHKPYDLQIVTIYCHVADVNGKPLPYPEKSELMLDATETAPAPGDYTLSPASLYVDRNGRLAVAPKLVPIAAKA